MSFLFYYHCIADPHTAAVIVALVGLHPAAAECIGWFACQPILFAVLGSLLATEALMKLREGTTIRRRLAFVAAATATLFTYEAAVALPLLLIGLDWFWPSNGGRRRPSDRWATAIVLATYLTYVAVMLWNRAGTTVTDASYRAGLREAIENIRTDLANYMVKVLPMPPYGVDTYTTIGSWTGASFIAVVAILWLARMKSSRIRTIGLLAFTITLAPSVLTRATVSVLNFPSFRQLYLPLASVAVLLCAWRPRGFRRTGLWVAGFVILALVILYQTMAPPIVRTQDRLAQREAGIQLKGLLTGIDADVPIIQIGESSCGYSLHFDADGREVWKLIPPTTEGNVPLLRALDERTVEVWPPQGKTLAFSTGVPPDPHSRRDRFVPSLLITRQQRLTIATAHALPQPESAVNGFRLVFDRPLANYLFIQVSGCAKIEHWFP